MPAAAAGSASTLLSLEPELQVQVLRGLGPADLHSARLACSGLRSLADAQVVTGLQLDVVRSERCLEADPIHWPEDAQGDGRPSLARLQAEEADIEEELGLDLPQVALQLFAVYNTLIHEQQGTAELQQLARQHERLVEMLEQHKRLHEVRRQQVEVRLEQAAAEVHGHRRGGCDCVVDGAALSAVLAAAPLGLLEQLALSRCRLSDAVAAR